MKLSILKLLRVLSFVFILLFLAVNGFSQNVKNLEVELFEMQQSSDNTVKAEALHLKKLVQDVQPTLYFQSNKVINTEEQGGAVRIITDASSVNLLYQENVLYKSVKLICIKIETPADLQMLLDVNRLKGITELKYIYFLCTFNMCVSQAECESSEIIKMLKNAEGVSYSILYNTSISE